MRARPASLLLDLSDFESRRLPGRPWVRWTLTLGAYTFVGALVAGEFYLRRRLQGESPNVVAAFLPLFAWAYTWALFTPVILHLSWRFPFDKERWPRSLLVHIFASLLIAWIGSVVFNAFQQLVGSAQPGMGSLFRSSLTMFVLFLHFDPLFYWIVLGLSYLVRHYQESRERELRASQLETQLAEARLQALEAQLHPHFLFNALNTITALVRTNRNAQAIRVVTGLGELLRHVLDSAGTQAVPLKQELEFVRRYLEIEQIRFGDRLSVEWHVERCAEDARVPYLILQPLVENAIQHGFARRASAGLLQITVRLRENRLQLAVHDDGPGLAAELGAPRQDGVGLTATQKRLEQLYGDDYTLEVYNADAGGVTAEIEIPYQVASDAQKREA